MNIRIKKSFLALGLGAAVLGGAARPSQAKLLGISEQDEIQAGKQVAEQAKKEYGGAMPYNHPYSIRVRAIGARFAALSTRKSIPYSYTVLNDTKVLNAFAAPGGPVFVTRKLVETTSNDAELAYVLGHETGHIERKHVVKSVEKQQKAGILVGVLGAILGGKNGNTIGGIASVGYTVISRGYSRDDENEADAVGVRWMSQLGFDPRASVTMLGKLGDGSGGGLDKYLATHPDPKVRQQRMRDLIQSENLIQVATRAGGPKLSAGYDTGKYANPDYTTTDGNIYPHDTTPPRDGDNTYYPPATSDGTDSRYPGSDSNGRLDWGAPLRVYDLGNGTGTVTAPVGGFARWAGARVTSSDGVTTITRGNNRMKLTTGSRTVVLNGETLTMSAPTQGYNGALYAPLGYLAAAVNAKVTMDADGNTVRLQLDGRDAGYLPVPEK